MKDRTSLQINTGYIGSYFNATIQEIPILVLEYWVSDIDISELLAQNQKSLGITVFVYALAKYHEQQGKEKFSFTSKELISLFDAFQILGSLDIIRQKADIKSINILSFNNYSNLNIEIQ